MKPGAIARGRRFTARCLPRGEKEKERSKVRASGPDTDRFSRSRDTDEVEEEEDEEEDVDEEKEEVEGKEIKGSIFPPSEYPRRAKSPSGQTALMALIHLTNLL